MLKEPIKTAVIGIGSWGKQIARELTTTTELTGYVSTGSEDNVSWAAENLPGVPLLTLKEVCADKSIQAVAIATPIKTHAEIADQLLKAKKHIFIEKPTAVTSHEARSLAEKAAGDSLILVTGYVFLYSPVYRELKRLIGKARIQKVLCTWNKYGTFTEPIELNLLTHHLAIALNLLGKPCTITARRTSFHKGECNNIVTTLSYTGSTFLSSIDRASKDRLHTVEVLLDDGTSFLWDDTVLLKRQAGQETYVSIYENSEKPLGLELRSFVEAVQGEKAYLPSRGEFGIEILEMLEQIRMT